MTEKKKYDKKKRKYDEPVGVIDLTGELNDDWLRARRREDIVRLAKDSGMKAKDILELKQADYRYRLKLPKDHWIKYLARKGAEIDYPNFKDIVPARDHARHQAYMNCWAAPKRWQDAKD